MSVRSYWETRCDAAACNNLAFAILAYVDELLSMFSMHVTDPTPQLRLVREPDDDDNLYLVVDPSTITKKLLVSSAVVQSTPTRYLHSALAIWEVCVSDKLNSYYVRGEPAAMPPAPAPYIEQTLPQAGDFW